MEKVGLELEGFRAQRTEKMDRERDSWSESAAVLGTGNLGTGTHVNQGLPATSFLYDPRGPLSAEFLNST